MSGDEPDTQAFIRLEDYEPPTLPAEETFRRILGRIYALMSRGKPKPFIADERLQKATRDTLDEIVAPPACGPLLQELDRTIEAWLNHAPKLPHAKAVILPPGDRSTFLAAWAKQSGHQILPPPNRGALLDDEAPTLPPLDGPGLLVIPELSEWLLRHRRGLRTIRALLKALDTLDRPVVLGCNSWAWSFLGKAAGADLLLPDAITFRAFDAPRLAHWFQELATAEATEGVRFRLPSTGADVLATDEDGKLESDFLNTLAGRSLGIPWVAWHMWRRSMRSARDDADPTGNAPKNDAPPGDAPTPAASIEDASIEDADSITASNDPGEQTLWVAALDEYILPGAHERAALLVLQALLIHGPLTPEHLRLVLPSVAESNVVQVLAKAGFIERHGDRYACVPAAYPATRAGLASAGMSTDGF